MQTFSLRLATAIWLCLIIGLVGQKLTMFSIVSMVMPLVLKLSTMTVRTMNSQELKEGRELQGFTWLRSIDVHGYIPNR